MLVLYFRCYGNLKFPLAYNGKKENVFIAISL